MSEWSPTTIEAVEAILADEVRNLHPEHARRFLPMRVPARRVSVSSAPYGSVVVVAEHEGKVLYWSDIEEGWELEAPTAEGGIAMRGYNQFELSHILHQLFGSPESAP